MAAVNEFEDEEVPQESSGPRTVRVAGRNYAVALTWVDVEDRTDPDGEARKIAARPSINADLYCIRSQGEQFGLGFRADGHAKNMPSLAGLLADSRSGGRGDWLGIFAVEGVGHYIVAVRDDKILGQTDKVWTDEIDARAAFEAFHSNNDWAEVFTPENYGFEGAVHTGLAELVKTGRKAPRLRGIDRVSPFTKVLGTALAILLVLGGGFYYMNYLNEQEYQRELARLAEQARANLPGGGEPVIEIPPMPWEGKPVAGRYLASCSSGMRQALLDIPGWRSATLTCGGETTVQMALERTAPLGAGGGTVNTVRWARDNSALPKAQIAASGQNGLNMSWPFAQEIERNPPELPVMPPAVAQVQAYMQSWFEESFTPVSFASSDTGKYSRSVKFKFDTPYDPARFSTILDRVPGMTVEKVSVDLRRQPFLYSVEGSFHEQLPLPKNAVRRGSRPGQPGQASMQPASAQQAPRN